MWCCYQKLATTSLVRLLRQTFQKAAEIAGGFEYRSAFYGNRSDTRARSCFEIPLSVENRYGVVTVLERDLVFATRCEEERKCGVLEKRSREEGSWEGG